ETHPGSGSFVSENNDIPDQALELLFHREQSMFAEMYEARKVFEPQLLYTASKNIQQQDIEALNESLKFCEKVIEKNESPDKFSEYIDDFRSEEHTSELQSRFDLVCRLLLEKKKINIKRQSNRLKKMRDNEQRE